MKLTTKTTSALQLPSHTLSLHLLWARFKSKVITQAGREAHSLVTTLTRVIRFMLVFCKITLTCKVDNLIRQSYQQVVLGNNWSMIQEGKYQVQIRVLLSAKVLEFKVESRQKALLEINRVLKHNLVTIKILWWVKSTIAWVMEDKTMRL